ncbi:hypothetical protein BUALT_Bualt08G0075900 [Buddleja alternifolia]|uniref:Homeobox domain-containing protein n=1 Tax=Buddleja alternifolia TaxID=168488 RepID=A0AAV6XFC9_9LAMI|nr:hypothetical protein BUALT_Bualt08G0075900 [Buddleja alternifolia]
MASFYSNLSNEGDNMHPTSYLSYPNLLSGTSLSTHGLVESESMDMQQINRQLNIAPRYSDGNTVISDLHGGNSEQFPQYHGLSLSLGSQEQSTLPHLPSDLNQFTNSSFSSLLTSQNNDLKNVQYLSFDLAGKTEAVNGFQNFISPKETSFMPSLEVTGTFCNSKYLKATQELLDELVNLRGAYKRLEKGQNFSLLGQDGFRGTDVKRDEESSNSAPRDLSPSERHDLQNKVTKLLSMLDEVDRRYKQYCHQMQVVVSSFDMVAGRGAAQPYTALALKTISRQFRSLRDAIKKQIQAFQKSLGEQDVNSHGPGVLSRLRYVDQQLRQQKALQQFGIMRQPWRPQRGLPENAVSVLRAWLFEHFLHPYPKDSEKIVLARQTGLTRGQVANWFINARVRLWKPMIEEMYKEEFGDAENEPKSSPEPTTTNQEISAFADREENFHRSFISASLDGNQRLQSNEMRPNAITSLDDCRAELSYENVAFEGNEVNFGLHNKQFLDATGNSIFSGNNVSPERTGNQVSLALGLQQSEKDSQTIIHGGIQPKGNEATSSSSSMVLDKLDYYYVDPVNNQHRFANSHLLSDFVA